MSASCNLFLVPFVSVQIINLLHSTYSHLATLIIYLPSLILTSLILFSLSHVSIPLSYHPFHCPPSYTPPLVVITCHQLQLYTRYPDR